MAERLNAALLAEIGNITPLFKKISGTGSHDLIAAVTGLKIKLVGFMLTTDAAGTFKLQSGATTDLTGAIVLVINTGVGDGVAFPSWIMETVAGEKLNLVASNGAANFAGYLRYFTE